MKRGRRIAFVFLLCVVAQWAQAQINGSATTYAWFIKKQLNETIELKTHGSWSYSIEGVWGVQMTKNNSKKEDAGGMGAVNVKREYRARVRAGKPFTITVRCSGIRGDECEEPNVQVGVMSDWRGSKNNSPSPRVGKTEKRGPATATITYTVDRTKQYGEDDILHLNLYGHMGGAPAGSHVFNKPMGAGALSVDVYLSIINADKEIAENEIDEPTTPPEEEDVGPHYEEDNEAWGFDGVWPFAIPASVIAAILGYTLTRRKEGDGDSKEQNPDPCEMQIYKDFGNSLLAGDMPQQVYARIIRKNRQGGEYPDPSLTALIQITSGDGYMAVQDGGMQNGWRMAWIGAPETDNAPEEGIVNFRMGNAQGSYTNRLHFHIEGGEVIFAQENLTLPAYHTKEERLPFLVTGLEGNAIVNATITNASGQATPYYSVRVEWNEKDRLHYAVIRDLMLDKEKDPGVPGKYLTFRLNIDAKSRSGRPVTGGLYLYRFYMGLRFDILDGRDVKCFLEEYDSKYHRTDKCAQVSAGKKYVPAETRCQLTYFDYDEEKHCILQLGLPTKDFVIKAADENKQPYVDRLSLQMEEINRFSDSTICLLRCTRATIDAPNRIDGVLTVSVKHGEKEVTLNQPVRLCSQPFRRFANEYAMSAALKEDDRITDRLYRIRSEIYRNQLVDRLFPLLNYIDMVVEGYDPDYGYNKKALQTITQTYNDVFTGVKAGANAEGAKPLTLADDMRELIFTWYEGSKTVSQSVGLLIRLGVIVTMIVFPETIPILGPPLMALTVVDTVTVSGEVVESMKEYVDEKGNEANVWGGFYVGAKIAMREYLMSKVFEYGMKGIGAGARSAGLTPEAMRNYLNNLAKGNKKPYSSNTRPANLKKAVENNNRSRTQAKTEAAADMPPKNPPRKPGKADTRQAESYVKVRAKNNISDLRTAVEMYKANPTPENQKMLHDIIIKCQGDHDTMRMLKKMGPEYTDARKTLNEFFFGKKAANGKVSGGIYRDVDAAVMRELRKRYNIKKIRKKNISSTNMDKIHEGKTTTRDRDTTYEYFEEKTKEWITIDDKTFGNGTEKAVREIYNRAFHEKTTGIKRADSKKLAELEEEGVDTNKYQEMEKRLESEFAKKEEQTIIQNEQTNPDSYGKDHKIMMDKNRHGERLEDAKKVGETVEYKGKEYLDSGRKKWQDAQSMTDPNQKIELEADAIGDIKEGCYQEVKILDQFTDSMDVHRQAVNGGSKISPKLRKGIEYLRDFHDGKYDLAQTEARLSRIGYNSIDDVCRDHGQTITAIGS